MHSLYARVTLAALLVLALFLGLAGWTLERAFRDSAGAAVQERLQAQIYGLLAAADLDADDRLVLPERLPEERFQRPGSGLYAQVLQHGEAAIVWRSPSQLLQDLPAPPPLPPGEWRFRHVQVDGNDARGEADPGLAAAAAEARRRTGGQVLSAERYSSNGETRYRIKVLTPDGRVRILNLDAR